MTEAARKHRAFDGRYRRRQPLATAAPTSARVASGGGDARLDWRAFAAWHFRGRRRHDLTALAAFEAYRDGAPEWPGDVEARQAGIRLAGCRSVPAVVERSEAACVSTAVQAWKDEGGASAIGDRTSIR